MHIRRSLPAFALALAAAAGTGPLGAAPQRGAPPPQIGTGFIAGRVVEGSPARAVPGATVTLFGSGPLRIVDADEQGRFFFAGLPAASFQVNAAKAGYNQLAAFLARPIPLGAGERRTDVTLRLVRHATIAGAVRDDVNDPVVGTDVIAFRRTLASGRWMLRRVAQARTDDRGVYRITGIDPGDYVVCACARDPIPFDGLLLTTIASEPLQLMSVAARALSRGADVADLDATLRTYAPTFYGNTVSAAQAQRIVLASGEEKASVDIVTPVTRATRVSGRIVGGTVNASTLSISPVGNAGFDGAIGGIPPMLVQADGRFDFAGVPPGQYVLRVTPRPIGPGGMSGAALSFLGARAADVARPAPSAPVPLPPGMQFPPPGPTMWAEETVVVGEQGARDVILPLRSTISVAGRIVFEDPAQTSKFALGFTLVPSPADMMHSTVVSSSAKIDGTFVIANLMPGRYALSAGAGAVAGSPVYIRSVTLAGADVTDLPIEFGATDASELVVTYANGTLGGIDGTLAGLTAQPAESLTALIFPVERKFWSDPIAARRLFRTVPISRDGTFAVGVMPSMDYFVAVVQEEAAVDWQEPSRIEALSRTAERVVVSEGRRSSVSVRR